MNNWDQEEENMEPINTWVENYNVSISTSEPAVFNTVDPNDESTETWMVPVYLGRVIGVQLIPVETSSTSYDNNGTSNLEYEFTGLGYLDDSSVTSEAPSDNGFGVRYQMDLAQDISTGPKMMETESEFEYHTVMEWGNGVYIDKFLTVDNDLDYFISVVE